MKKLYIFVNKNPLSPFPEQDQQQMPKSVRDGAQMSRVLAQVLSQRDWNLCNRKAGIREAADHLCGKFHTTALESSFQGCGTGYAPQTAVKIGKIYPKSASSQPGQ
jgi:hypothetical protein